MLIKKTVLILLCTLLFTSIVNAQNDKKMGFKGGLNITNIAGDHTGEGNSPLMGFNFSFFAELPQTNDFSFQPEISISQQGYQLSNEGYEVDIRNLYINIPVMFKYYVPIAEGFSFQAGPQMGYLISSKMKGEVNGVSIDEDVKDQHEEIDFTLAMGLGLKTNSMNFNIRYNMGLTSVFGTPGSSNQEIKAKNSVLQFSVGIPIN